MEGPNSALVTHRRSALALATGIRLFNQSIFREQAYFNRRADMVMDNEWILALSHRNNGSGGNPWFSAGSDLGNDCWNRHGNPWPTLSHL